MKGCGRLDPFSVITYHLGLFFSPFSLAASSERMGTLEGEPSSELNIEESWCVILVLICKATQGQPVGWLASADCSTHAGLHFFKCSTHTNTFRKKGASSVVCSYDAVWRPFSSLLPRSCYCSVACFSGHLWLIVISANQSRPVQRLCMAEQKGSVRTPFLSCGILLSCGHCKVMSH